jgi:hypothetical protein
MVVCVLLCKGMLNKHCVCVCAGAGAGVYIKCAIVQSCLPTFLRVQYGMLCVLLCLLLCKHVRSLHSVRGSKKCAFRVLQMNETGGKKKMYNAFLPSIYFDKSLTTYIYIMCCNMMMVLLLV